MPIHDAPVYQEPRVVARSWHAGVMQVDPFADVLRLVEAKSVLSGSLDAGGSWAFRFHPREKVKVYLVAEGSCWLGVEGQGEPRPLGRGDVLLLSGSRATVIGGSPRTPPVDACPVFEKGGTFAKVGARSECVLLTGVVSLHPSSAELVTRALAPLVHVRASDAEAASLRWILERIASERRSALPGAELVSAQLAQLLFIELLRAHVASSAELPPGWLRALRDERIVRALRLMHDDPGRAWRLGELSKAAAMSRARFAARFKTVARVPPLAYLTTWRMHVARKMLRDEDARVVEVAARLGYRSESAFSNAFKRVTGTGPRAYRRTEARRSIASLNA